jgi:hypothetical protein
MTSRYIPLAEVQRLYRKAWHRDDRESLRRYIIDGGPSSPFTYQTVDGHLYAGGEIDKLGLSPQWLETASESDRARAFSRIATARIQRRPR